MPKVINNCKNGREIIFEVEKLKNAGSLCKLCDAPIGGGCTMKEATQDDIKRHKKYCPNRNG